MRSGEVLRVRCRVTAAQALLVLLAGAAAGAINAVVGAGTLITFSTLVALGFPPLVSNVSNTVGLVAGSVAGSVGYRSRLVGQAPRLRILRPASLIGAAVGAVLLLVLPASAFRAIVPGLILVSVVLVVLQPRLQRDLSRHRAGTDPRHGTGGWPDPVQSTSGARGIEGIGWGTRAAVFGTGIYGGYFGAAQGVLLLGILGTWLDPDLQRVNALKNVLAGAVNALAAVLFVVLADVNWAIAGLLLLGSTVGGWTGARVGDRMPESVLRTVIVVVGLIAVVILARG